MARQRIDLRLDEDLLDYIESSKGIKTRTAFIEAALRAQAADAERGDEAGGTNGSSAGRR